ncbi:3-keto-disaccharide hydrolase [Rubripirellula reticaptiva]|uniref:3-keto-alpha-glucoside-1,2-lyase/3-keto-2-hydroxy-glucal hydratase domain-containing protein n=1 Tax=Rubripirellula reticaptiva TaxID=2528013 RepID=A0A5C6FD73_9BACT|nr:DUF1080 domain-containing protein [Rubripirellula reticaptiva]TWU57541.1 hypothetical protein Poly59_04480 [Rubripirellula reticaptiva]
MKRLVWMATVALLFALPCPTPAQNPATTPIEDFQSESLPLFDGHSLAGWEGNAYWFRIEPDAVNGNAIVAGRLDEKIPHNEFLCTTQNYDNFELRYDVKLVGEGKNAGVQFRSKRVSGSTEVSGYQADAGEAWKRPVWGALYDESRRKKMLAEGDKDAVVKLVKKDDWNSLRVICRDKHIEIYLNGEKTIDYTEDDESIPTFGLIGLQIHSGPPTEAWYRNIRVRQL